MERLIGPAKWLTDALKHDPGQRSLADVTARIAAGDAQLWTGKRCAVVTEWIIYPNRKAVNVWLMGGDIKELLGPMLERIEAWATEQGASEIFGGASWRPGWLKTLRKAGFEPQWIMVSKELTR